MDESKNLLKILDIQFDPDELSNLNVDQLEKIQQKLNELIEKVDKLRLNVEV